MPGPVSPAGILAHPLTQPYHLPVSPLAAAFVAAGIVLLVTLVWPEPRRAAAPRAPGAVESWDGSLSRWNLVGRAAGVVLLALAIAAGRLGVDDELENLAPALVVGAAWPLLVLASIAAGPVWRFVDPWDSIARLFVRVGRDEPPGHVWPACAVALVWVWYVSAYTDPLAPRSVGLILALYTTFTVAACLAVGRRRWLASGEPLGIVLSWMALFPRRSLTRWSPPRGAEALLGVLAGGLLFGAVRHSELWGGLNTDPHARLLAAVGLLAGCAAAASVLIGAARATPRAPAATARAAVPAIAGIVLAVAMERNRLTTSVQLLPGLLGDPFGEGWDLFGDPTHGLDPAPLGVRGLILAQLALVVGGHAAGGVVLVRSVGRPVPIAVAAALAGLAGASVIALAAH